MYHSFWSCKSLNMFFKLILCCTFLYAFVSVYGQENGNYDYLCPSNNTEGNKHAVVPGFGCTRFVSCDDGIAYGPQSCPPTTLFSEEEDKCEHEENVTCSDEGSDCKMKAVSGSCNNYTDCSYGKAVNMTCGEGTVFSNTNLVCNYPESLSTEDKIYCGFETSDEA